MVFDLSIPDEALLPRMVEHQWFKQEFPVGGETRRPILAHEGEIFLPVLVVGYREHLVLGRQPLHKLGTVAAMPVRLPIRRITAAQTKQRVLRIRQRQIVGIDLHDQDCHVNVIEKIQIYVRHTKSYGNGTGAGKRHPYLGDITAAKYVDAGLLMDIHVAPFPFSIEEPLDVGEKRHELAVMALLE